MSGAGTWQARAVPSTRATDPRRHLLAWKTSVSVTTVVYLIVGDSSQLLPLGYHVSNVKAPVRYTRVGGRYRDREYQAASGLSVPILRNG